MVEGENYMIPQKFYFIPQDTYWYPKAPIDTPGHLLIPHPVVLIPQGPVAPAILIQIRWFLYHWKAKNQIYKMVSFVCQSVDICLYKWATHPWITNFHKMNNFLFLISTNYIRWLITCEEVSSKGNTWCTKEHQNTQCAPTYTANYIFTFLLSP